MKRYNFLYYIREGFGSIFNHGLMSFASVCIIVACLIIMGSFSLLALNVNSILSDFESENVLLAFIDERIPINEAMALEDPIEDVDNVDDAVFISRQEAMDKFISKYDDKERFDNIDEAVFRHRFAVYVEDIATISETQAKLSEIAGVENVSANLAIAKGFVTLRNIVSGVSIVLVAILLIISLFIMSNTIKLATFERREEIAIMRMVGATNGFIRWPFIYEGFILGTMGSLIAYIAQWGIYTFITDRFIESAGITFIRTMPFSEVALPMLIVFVAVGLAIGVVGSSMAIRKYLKV